MSMDRIDLNCDMGEGFGPYRAADDDALMGVITSANVACGYHAGDPEIMAKTFATAREHGVAIGAHPGFPDLWGFGRRIIPFSTGEVERLVAYQIGAAQAVAAYAGHSITYVKPHGALGNLTQPEPEIAKAICRAVKAVDPNLVCMSFTGGNFVRFAQELGLKACAEIYADRAYDDKGWLVPRSIPGAVLHDPEAAAKRVVRMVQAGSVETIEGRLIPMPIETVCIHGDTPGAIETARFVRRSLEGAGIVVESFTRRRRP